MAHRIRLSLLCRCKWTRKSQVWYGNVLKQYLLLCKNKTVYCVYTQIGPTQEILVHAQDSCACTRFLCMHNTLLHAQHSCACTGGAKAQGRDPKTSTCTIILCMHKNLVHAQYTLLFLHYNKYCSETFPYQTWAFLVHLHLHSRLRRIQWAIVLFSCKNQSIYDLINFMHWNENKSGHVSRFVNLL